MRRRAGSAVRSSSPATPSRPTNSATAVPTTAPPSSARGVAGDDHGLRAMAGDFDGALPHLQLIADARWILRPAGARRRRGLLAGRPGAGPGVARGRCARPSGTFSAAGAGRCSTTSPRRWRRAHCRITASPCCASTRGSACSATQRRTPQAMIVLDRCRIRSGVVLEVAPRPRGGRPRHSCGWDGERLALGHERDRDGPAGIDGVGLVLADDGRRPGRAALGLGLRRDHRRRRTPALRHYSDRHLDLVNAWLAAQRSVGAGHG